MHASKRRSRNRKTQMEMDEQMPLGPGLSHNTSTTIARPFSPASSTPSRCQLESCSWFSSDKGGTALRPPFSNSEGAVAYINTGSSGASIDSSTYPLHSQRTGGSSRLLFFSTQSQVVKHDEPLLLSYCSSTNSTTFPHVTVYSIYKITESTLREIMRPTL